MYNWPHRKHQRLKDYDYSQDGIYFLTFCCYKKQCFLWEIIEGKMVLNEYGKIVEKCWSDIPEHFDNIELWEFIVMPNHVHWIVQIVWHSLVGTADLLSLQWDKPHSKWQNRTKMILSKVIQWHKSSVTRRIRQEYNDYEFTWQRSFYDVIIKNEDQLSKTKEYIKNNPLKWELDSNNPKNEEEVKRLRELHNK